MKLMTRFLALLLATLLCLIALVACTPNTPSNQPSEQEKPDNNSTGTTPPPSDEDDPNPNPSDNDSNENEVPEEMNRYLYKRVVLIGVDGAGAFFRDTDTPCIDEIFENGAISYNVLTSNPTISAQCWGS